MRHDVHRAAAKLAFSMALLNGCAAEDPTEPSTESAATLTDVDAAPPPVSVCTSGITTSPTDPPSELMNPGMACVACHKQQQGPDFELGGTVYPTAHEPDSCGGAATARVLVIDAVGNVHTADANANANGNFYFDSATPIPRPYRAMVIHGTAIRQMKTPQSDGDCNGCHTEWGSRAAPGRVQTPRSSCGSRSSSSRSRSSHALTSAP